MNAPASLARASYEPASLADWSYEMQPEDFAECFVVTNAVTGLSTGHGKNKLGLSVSLPLGVPLCKGCDGIIHDNVCDDCEVVFVAPETIEPARFVMTERARLGRVE